MPDTSQPTSASSRLLRPERKSFSDVIVDVNIKKREVTAHAAIFENVDRKMDMMHPGSFTQTLRNGPFSRGDCAYKYNHGMAVHDGFLLGKALHAEEDTKGLLTVGRVSRSSSRCDEKLEQMNDGSLPTYSIYYGAVPARTERKGGIRHLREVALYEFGPVDPDLAVNPEARVLSVKGAMFSTADYVEAIGEFVRELETKGALCAEDRALARELFAAVEGNVVGLKALVEQIGDGSEPGDEPAGAVSDSSPDEPLRDSGSGASAEVDGEHKAATSASDSLLALHSLSLTTAVADLSRESAALALMRAAQELQGRLSTT